VGDNVKIGPYSIIGSNVIIGDNTVIGNHVTICDNTLLGKDCNIFHSSVIGEIPQDLKFKGEKTDTVIGERTTIREFVTINRGTSALGKTEIGSDCLLMAYVHVAHDCIIGNNVIMSNMATLGGHVSIGDWVSLGGGVLVHQFCRIGAHAFIGGGFRVVQDVPPFILGAEEPLTFQGINRIGLKRKGYSAEDRKSIKNIYHIFFRSRLNRQDALSKIKSDFSPSHYRDQIIDFISYSDRGII
jgi:UDP-N-acetylglucosamine acyltransferase|tara:strand:- start:2339 stop:3064 length:726 start_codon:yes stop_codon:yes gene_type:complete